MSETERSEGRNSGGTEAERRQDGAGRNEPHPAGEAARGNVEPDPDAPAEARAERSFTGADGHGITIEEGSGSAAASARAEGQAKRSPA